MDPEFKAKPFFSGITQNILQFFSPKFKHLFPYVFSMTNWFSID